MHSRPVLTWTFPFDSCAKRDPRHPATAAPAGMWSAIDPVFSSSVCMESTFTIARRMHIAPSCNVHTPHTRTYTHTHTGFQHMPLPHLAHLLLTLARCLLFLSQRLHLPLYLYFHLPFIYLLYLTYPRLHPLSALAPFNCVYILLHSPYSGMHHHAPCSLPCHFSSFVSALEHPPFASHVNYFAGGGVKCNLDSPDRRL